MTMFITAVKFASLMDISWPTMPDPVPIGLWAIRYSENVPGCPYVSGRS